MKIRGLDVTVDDPLPMQAPDCASRGGRAGDDIGNRKHLPLREKLLERAAFVPIEHDIERRSIRDLADAYELVRPKSGNTQAEPRLVREHRALLRIARARFVQRLDRDELAGLAVARLIKTMDAVVGDEGRDAKA